MGTGAVALGVAAVGHVASRGGGGGEGDAVRRCGGDVASYKQGGEGCDDRRWAGATSSVGVSVAMSLAAGGQRVRRQGSSLWR
jgi:hypothetical protein